jgi:peroxiredoxin
MKQSYRTISLGFVLVAVFCLSSTVLRAQGTTGSTEPSLKFQTLDGSVVDLAQSRGSVVLISFGATWCAPCTTELHALEELLAEYRTKPVKVFWVSIERPDEVSNGELKRYAKTRRVTFPVLRDTDKMVFLQFTPRVRLPMVLFLAKDGHLDAPVKFGMQSQTEAYKTEMRARLNKLLGTRSEGDR